MSKPQDTVRWSLRIPPRLAQAITLLAEVEDQSINEFMIGIMEARVAQAQANDEERGRVAARIREQAEAFGLLSDGKEG